MPVRGNIEPRSRIALAMFDWIIQLLDQTGAFGIALLMFLENVFPPIPSELIMPMAGFSAARGAYSIWMVIGAGTAGALAGAAFWYWIGRSLGLDRAKRFSAKHGRWLTLCPPDLERAMDRFERHGAVTVFIGRMIPALRSVISIPAGVNRMPLAKFLFFTSLGTALWTSLLALAGYLLETQYELVADYLNPVSNVIFAILLLWYLYRVVTFGRHHPGEQRGTG